MSRLFTASVNIILPTIPCIKNITCTCRSEACKIKNTCCYGTIRLLHTTHLHISAVIKVHGCAGDGVVEYVFTAGLVYRNSFCAESSVVFEFVVCQSAFVDVEGKCCRITIVNVCTNLTTKTYLLACCSIKIYTIISFVNADINVFSGRILIIF